MANETPRMKITYPSIGEANYFSNYQAGMNDIDAGIFATWSASNTITNGGGTLTWALVGPSYTLTWTAPIAFQTPAFGTAQSIALGSLVIPQGLLAYTDIAFGSTAASTSLVLTAASQAPVDTAALVLAWHNPTTHALHFATGLVLALGGTATGIQPQGGGGGGSISVTDGAVTVNPATTITVVGGVVADLGGGNAEITIAAPVTPPLITQFVVDQNGGGSHTEIFKALQDASAQYIATGLDQIVFVRGGTYTETLVLYDGVALVAEASPQTMDAKKDSPFSQIRTSPTAVIVEGEVHTFEPVGGQIRCTIRGIVFSSISSSSAAMFALNDTSASLRNKVSFVDCFFFSDSSGAIWEQSGKDTPDVEVSFYGCKFRWEYGASVYDPMFYFGSNGSNQLYLFTDCEFFARYTGRMIFRSDSGAGGGEVKITRCKFDKVDISDGYVFSALNADLSLTDVVMQQPDKNCVVWNNSGTVYTYGCCTLEVAGSYPAISAAGPIIYSSLFTAPWTFTQQMKNVDSAYPIVANYVMPYRAVEGTTYQAGGLGTILLEDWHLSGGTITNVSWNTSVGGAGTRTVDLHNAAYTQGMYFTVWDSGNTASSRNISVTSTNSVGGVTGPHASITHNNGSLTFVASVDAGGDPCWRSISYYH